MYAANSRCVCDSVCRTEHCRPVNDERGQFLFLTNYAYGLIIDWHGLFPVKSTCARSKVYVHTQCAVLNVSVLNASNVCELLVIQPPLPRAPMLLVIFVFEHALPPAATGVATPG